MWIENISKIIQAIYNKSMTYILVNRGKNKNICTKMKNKTKIVHSLHIYSIKS